MAAANDNTRLLLVLPGAAARLPVLQRLMDEAGQVTVLVQAELSERSSWAKPLVAGWIEFGPPAGQVSEDLDGDALRQLAWQAVREWLEGSGAELQGCMTYDEWGVEICSYLCAPDRLNLPITPLETVLQLRDKPRFRQRCAEAGLPAVRSVRVQNRAELAAAMREGPRWNFPVILKPAKGAGSYWVRKADTEAELLAEMSMLDRTLQESKMPSDDIAAGWTCEEFFAGSEVDVDGWARDGVVEWLMVSDNNACVAGSCGETGGIYPSQLPAAIVVKLEELTRSVVAALPGLHSCFHFEALANLDSGEVMPIEMNLRTGGAECPLCVEAVSGYFLPLVAADLALGRPARAPAPATAAVAASTNVHFPTAGILKACGESGAVKADPDYLGGAFFGAVGKPYIPNRGSISCVAWLAAGGADAATAESNLQRCISECDFRLEADEEPDGEHTSHYKHVAEIYNTNLFYDLEGPIVQWQKNTVLKHMGLAEGEVLADIGGGTGAFTKLLGKPEQLLLVEPSKEMLAQAPPELKGIRNDAVGFAKSGTKVDCILIKEAIHHMEDNLDGAMAALRRCLSKDGRMLVLTRPREPEYPFFEAAKAGWRNSQSPISVYVEAMERSGFDATVIEERLPLRVKTATWCDMLRTRWWSCFAPVTEDELETGIQELRKKYEGQEFIDFCEVELFILAKPREAAEEPAGGGGCSVS